MLTLHVRVIAVTQTGSQMSLHKPSYHSGSLSIDPVKPDEMPVFRALLDGLVESLDMADIYTVTDEQLHEALFGEHPQMEAVIARYGGEPAGVATWNYGFHVVRGGQVMSFEYLYVKPQFRNHMVPFALLIYVMVLARRRGYFRIEGFVEEWNNQALGLYEKLHAESVDQKLWRMDLDKIDWSPYRDLLGPNTV
jgi:GNAT superfamily N-acetyltransferase